MIVYNSILLKTEQVTIGVSGIWSLIALTHDVHGFNKKNFSSPLQVFVLIRSTNPDEDEKQMKC